MNILALDTADDVLSLALAVKDEVWYSEIDAGVRHSELLMECVDGLCALAGIGPREIERVCCLKGPGSFTGLRIGYSAAKGLCLALGIPLAAFSTLDCMARPLSMWPGLILPLIDAKKGRFFAALYRGSTRVSGYLDASPEEIAGEAKNGGFSPGEALILTGSGADAAYPRFADLFPPGAVKLFPGSRRGRARELLEICKGSILEAVDAMNSGPDYLRKSDAELNWG